MNIDTELEAWRAEWQSDSAVSADLPRLDLRKTVERQTRSMQFLLIADIFVTITIGGTTAGWAMHSPRSENILLAAATWVFIAIAWTFSLAVNRGTWSPSAQNTAAFLDLSIRRCRSRLAAAWFAVVLFIVQIVFVLSWVYRNSPANRQPVRTWLLFSSAAIDLVWLSTLAFFAFVIWFVRRKRAELACLLNLQAQMPDLI